MTGDPPPLGERPASRRPAAPLTARLTARLSALGYATLATVVARLPEGFLAPVFHLVADIAWRRHGRGVRQLERNLRRVVPAITDDALSRLSRRAMRSYARYWMEFFRLPRIGRERILGAMSVTGKEHLQAAMAAGRGAILALPHSGNWDHAGAWVAAIGYPFTTVAERLEPASVFDRFVAVRERLGMEVLPLDGDAGSFGPLLRRLREGKLVCLVCERDLGGGGVEVSFFGEPMTMPVGPAALALASGAALLPTCLWFTDTGWAGEISSEVTPSADGDRRAKIADMTQRLADVFATGIARHPQDWHMLQPLWSADRNRSAGTSAGADGATPRAAERARS